MYVCQRRPPNYTTNMENQQFFRKSEISNSTARATFLAEHVKGKTLKISFDVSRVYVCLSILPMQAEENGPSIHTYMDPCRLFFGRFEMYVYIPNIHTYIHTYIHTCKQTYIHTYKHTTMQTYKHTHTFIHIYIHSYIHTVYSFSPAAYPEKRLAHPKRSLKTKIKT